MAIHFSRNLNCPSVWCVSSAPGFPPPCSSISLHMYVLYYLYSAPYLHPCSPQAPTICFYLIWHLTSPCLSPAMTYIWSPTWQQAMIPQHADSGTHWGLGISHPWVLSLDRGHKVAPFISNKTIDPCASNTYRVRSYYYSVLNGSTLLTPCTRLSGIGFMRSSNYRTIIPSKIVLCIPPAAASYILIFRMLGHLRKATIL